MAAAWNPIGRRSLLSVVAVQAGRVWRKLRTAGIVGRAALTVALRLALTLAGLTAVDYGVWQWHHWLGWIAAGISLLLVEWTIKGDGSGP